MSFDAIAPHYERLERWFSRGHMHAARVAHLDRIEGCERVLLIGEGPGRFLSALVERFPGVHCTCVDISGQMLRRASDRLSAAQRRRVTFVQADIRQGVNLDTPADLIVTHFFFDCFDEANQARIIPALASHAAPAANWLIADFQIPSNGWDRWRARMIVSGLYGFFRVVAGLKTRRLASPDPWLIRCGFQRKLRTEFERRLLYSDWWQRGDS